MNHHIIWLLTYSSCPFPQVTVRNENGKVKFLYLKIGYRITRSRLIQTNVNNVFISAGRMPTKDFVEPFIIHSSNLHTLQSDTYQSTSIKNVNLIKYLGVIVDEKIK